MKMQLPPVQSTRSAWYGHELEDNLSGWTVHLSSGDVRELAAAAARCLALSDDVAAITTRNFLLDELT